MENYYELLEVSEKASQEVIEKAYKALSKKYHPDLQAEGQKALFTEKMKKINEAYEILSDLVKRKKYDEEVFNQQYNNDFADEDNEAVKQQAYDDAYYKYLNDLGYTIKEHVSFKDRLKMVFKLFVSIIVLILLAFILWLIPPIREKLINLYETNSVIKLLVDLIVRVLSAIKSIFIKG